MSRWSAAAERNREMVAENAERILNDRRYDRFRTPTALRRLAISYSIVAVLIPTGWLAGGSIVGIVAVLVGVGVYLLLRVAVRSVADLPDHVLDERLRRDRDSVYLDAFRLASSIVFLAANAALVAVAFRDGATITFGYDQVSAVYWTVFALVMGAPSVVMAWRQAGEPA
ncbi:MAG: hypothetical protein R2743_03520 [Ilumatobacteraceae bacterium]